jgi:TolB-like protein/predicted Ser/Thr protein kinase
MIGKTVSHYTILEELGRGGMGEVYLAEDTRLHRKVALKFLPTGFTRDAEAKERFMHEARAASKLDHPNICNVHEIDETDDGRIFICMAYYEGEPLKDKLGPGPLGLEKAIDTAVQIGEGLARAHESGITHRDIKPANIMVTDRGEVKIVDFGLAKLGGTTKLTKAGTKLGTVEYMSPEQARGAGVDHRTDIWSLGVVLYQMIVGRPPFMREYEQAVMYAIMNDDPEPVTALRTGVPREIDRILGKALAKNPEERYQVVSDLLVDLRAVRRQIEAGHRAPRPAGPRERGNRKWIYIAAAAAVIVVAALLLRGFLLPGRVEAIDSIAVLPLDNISQDPEQDYFVDGMTEALIANLARIGALKVISRTSVMRYKDTDKSLPEIARDLDVDAIVEGSVIRADGRVRITAQLIEARTDKHLWANSYDRDLRDILALQSEVAGAIASEIEVSVAPDERSRHRKGVVVDPAAHEAYLKGRYHWNKRTKDGIERSIEYFEEAIRIDPDFALAHAGLADAYIVLADWGYILPREGYAKGKEIALRALELDENLGEAHASYAAALKLLDYRWEDSEREFRRALELNPNYATVYQWYAELLNHLGRFDEAIVMNERALELDPLSLIINAVHAYILHNAGRYGEAIEQSERTLELDPCFLLSHTVMQMSYQARGMYEEALGPIKKSMECIGIDADTIRILEDTFESGGQDALNRLFIDTGTGMYYSEGIYNLPYYIATTYAALGETDSAFAYLEQIFEIGSMHICEMGFDKQLDPLRSDPRFTEMLRRIGLAERE